MEFTNDQKKAIFEKNSNILVSAGAGSGKTAVLTARTINNLNYFDLDQMIILTFTKAAAFSMKEKIKKALKEKKDFESLKKLDTASICTFDSFSLDLVKKYSYLLNIDSDINITDSVIISKLKKDIIDEVFTKFYENKEFLKLLDTFTVKDDSNIKSDIEEILNNLDKIYDPINYLDNYNIDYDFFINEYINLLNKRYESLKEKFVELTGTIETENDKKFLETLSSWLKFSKFDDYILFQNYNVKCSTKNELLKEKYAEFKEIVSEIKNLAIYKNKEEIKIELNESIPFIKTLISLTKEIIIRINEYKAENNYYEFNDITRLAIKLLKENLEIRDFYKNNIKEIMIDEYQDTNDIGEYFISLIANNNVFMVGDVKQSIYRFRNANPSIFIKKYNDYSKNINGIKIDLKENFRSRKEVLNNINMIFSKIMDENIGGANYLKDHIILSNDNYPIDKSRNMKILNYDENLYDSFEKPVIEAFIIANDIKNKFNNKYQIYDTKERKYHDFKYSDAAILLASKKEFELYKKIFDYFNIPLTIHKDEDLTYSSELIVIKNIIKLVGYYNGINLDNKLIKTYISVARSFVLNYSDQEIFEVLLKSKDKNLFDFIDESLKGKIVYLSEFINNHSITELVLEVLNVFEIYLKISSIGDADIISYKINHLIDIAISLEKQNYSLEEFINYLNDATKELIDFTLTSNKDMNSGVNIMSIHKSKGLEFNICYFADFNKKFSIKELNSRFLFNEKYGFITPIFKEGIKSTILKELYKNEYLKEEISERIRQFYVALTRAKEEIIIVTNLGIKRTKLSEETKLKYKSFKDILISLDLKDYILEAPKLEITRDYEKIKIKGKKICETSFKTIDIDIQKEELNNINYSNKKIELMDKTELEKGIKIHEYLEYIDFNNFKDSLNKLNLNEFYKNKIKNLINMPFIKKDAIYHKEYEFYYSGNIGKIDLLIETADTLIVVDYKTKEINKEYYFKQVKGYMNYLKTISNKKIEGYLYSILDSVYLKVT